MACRWAPHPGKFGLAARCGGSPRGYKKSWFRDLDSNQDTQLQRLMSYRLDDPGMAERNCSRGCQRAGRADKTVSGKNWRRGWDLDSLHPLKPRNLLILHSARNGENGRNAEARYTAGTWRGLPLPAKMVRSVETASSLLSSNPRALVRHCLYACAVCLPPLLRTAWTDFATSLTFRPVDSVPRLTGYL